MLNASSEASGASEPSLGAAGSESTGDPAAAASVDRVSLAVAELLDAVVASGAAVVGSATAYSALPARLRSVFVHTIRFEPPSKAERIALVQGALAASDAPDVLVGDRSLATALAAQSAGAYSDALLGVVEKAKAGALERMLATTEVGESPPPVCIDRASLVAAMEAHVAAAGAALGVPKVPNVKWDDVGGLEEAKAQILDTIWLPLQHPELFGDGMRQRSGLLLYGPPGVGKTLLAKAVATECALNFLSVKGPELINMYIGESEKNVRELFARARAASPCVIFFDELDALAPNRGQGADSGGVMDRIVSQLLAELDSLHSTRSIFVIGATNRPDLIDSGLMRPGRFDKLVYLGLSRDPAAKHKVLSALTRKFTFGDDVDLNALVALIPDTFTGADLYALTSDALLAAMKDVIAAAEANSSGADLADASGVVVCQAHLTSALAALTPSLTAADVAKYEALRDKYEARV